MKDFGNLCGMGFSHNYDRRERKMGVDKKSNTQIFVGSRKNRKEEKVGDGCRESSDAGEGEEPRGTMFSKCASREDENRNMAIQVKGSR